MLFLPQENKIIFVSGSWNQVDSVTLISEEDQLCNREGEIVPWNPDVNDHSRHVI